MSNRQLAEAIWAYIDNEILDIPSSTYLTCRNNDDIPVEGILALLDKERTDKL